MDSESVALPREEAVENVGVLSGEGFEDGLWGDEGGIQGEFRGAFIAPVPELAKSFLVVGDGFGPGFSEAFGPIG